MGDWGERGGGRGGGVANRDRHLLSQHPLRKLNRLEHPVPVRKHNSHGERCSCHRLRTAKTTPTTWGQITFPTTTTRKPPLLSHLHPSPADLPGKWGRLLGHTFGYGHMGRQPAFLPLPCPPPAWAPIVPAPALLPPAPPSRGVPHW